MVILEQGCPTCHNTYVDNVGVIGINPGLVQTGRENAKAALDAFGFTTYEFTGATWCDEALGELIDGKQLLVRMSDKRYSRIKGTIDWFLARRKASGEQFEILGGHLTFAFLLRRPLFSVLNGVYRFI